MTMLLLVSLATCRAFAADGGGAQLVAAFLDEAPSADFIFVLDTSGTLLPLAEAVRPDIAAFVEAVPEGDSVQIITFHTRASDVLPITRVDEAGRAALVEKVRTLELTSAKDQDLGAGLAYVASSVSRAKAGTVQFVFILSNFCHAPSLSSDYDSGGRGCRTIRGPEGITARFVAPRRPRLLTTHLFLESAPERPVPTGGLDQVRRVLSPVGVLEEQTEGFSTWLAGFRDKLALERVRPLARAEAGTAVLMATVTRHPTVEDPTAELKLTSGLRHLGLRLADVQVSGAVPGSAPTTVDLEPDGTMSLSVVVPEPPFSVLPRHDVVEIPIEVRANGLLLPAEGLQAIGIDPARPDHSFSTTLSVPRNYGFSGPVAALLLLAVFVASGFIAVWVRGRFLPKRLGGSFNYRHGSGPKKPLDIADLGEAAIEIASGGELAVGRPDKAVLVIRTVRPLWTAHVEVDIRSDDVEINRKRAPRGRQRIVPGATSFQFGDYRLTWE